MDYIELTAKILPLEVGRDILTAELADIGFESFVETEDGLQAYIQKDSFQEDEVQQLNILKQTSFNINYSLKTIEDQNWNEVWEKGFNPINVEDKCYIRAPFHEMEKDIELEIVIEPKMSFGTGHHETTYLMVKRILDLNIENRDVLDMGCGTGVLAILAKLKNANKVMAVDIDEWAYQNTIENISKNDNLSIAVEMGGVEVIKDKQFDVIFANINRNILLQDMEAYDKALKQGGSILFSGFFTSDKQLLLTEAAKYKLSLIYSDDKNDWALLHLIKA
jgi:ribosomal protein L11 methyltransferase